jgi:hypothetical protein
MQAIYEQGERKAEVRFGAECRPFDRAIWGMAEVMRAAGRDLPDDWQEPGSKFSAFVSRWHFPLAGAQAGDTLDRWRKEFPWAASMGLKRESSTIYYAMGALTLDEARWAAAAINDPEFLAKQADALLDREIKRAFPKVRRNTKKYRELADSKREQAIAMEREDAIERFKRKLHSAEEFVNRQLKELDKREHDADYWLVTAGDLEALDPNCPWAAEARKRGETAKAKVTSERQYLTSALAELTAVVELKAVA